MEKYKKSLGKKWSRSLMGGGRLREVVAHGEVRLYSQTTTNGTVTSLQRPLYFVPADSPYIDSYLNLSTTATATKTCPQLPK